VPTLSLKVTLKPTLVAVVGLGPLRLIERTRGAMVQTSPVKGRLFRPTPSLSMTPAESTRLSPISPVPPPVATLTVQVVPDPLRPVIDAAGALVSANPKLAAVNPVTASLKVTV
jgi:hypothetical protein